MNSLKRLAYAATLARLWLSGSGQGVGSVNERLEEIIRARLLASLGERAPAPWWRSQASTEVSGRWLERLSPRLAARLRWRSAAARRWPCTTRTALYHLYHLYRLPVPLEAGVHDVLARNDANIS